jgi:hypothetical protein
MAREAGYMYFAIGEFRVDILHHREHHTSRKLFRLLITRPVCNVTGIAHNAETLGGLTHCASLQVLRRKHLEVLRWARRTTATSTTAAAPGVLSEESSGANHEYEK